VTQFGCFTIVPGSTTSGGFTTTGDGHCADPLTDHQKREAIQRREEGKTRADIARSYNVSPATISRLTPLAAKD
jgi:CENP-B N-terminal DNA-binding domain